MENTKDEKSSEGEGERGAILAYLTSDDWEKRMTEARAKREEALAKRAQQQSPAAEVAGPPLPLQPPPPQTVAQKSPPLADRQLPQSGDDASFRPSLEAPVAQQHRVQPRWPLRDKVLGLLAVGACTLFAVGLVIEQPEPPVAVDPAAESPHSVTRMMPDDRFDFSTVRPDAGPTSAPELTGPEKSVLAQALESLGEDYRVTLIEGANRSADLTGLDNRAMLDIRTSPFALQRTTIAYFHDTDAEGARSLSAQLDAEILDLSGFTPAPPAGTLELRLGGG